MFCSTCGKKIDSSSKFCPYCGSKIQPLPNSRESSSQSQDPGVEQKTRPEQPLRESQELSQDKYSKTAPPSQVEAQPVKKKGKAATAAGIVLTILIVVMFYFTATGTGKKLAGSFIGSSSPQSNSTSTGDDADDTAESAEAGQEAAGNEDDADASIRNGFLFDVTYGQEVEDGHFVFATSFYDTDSDNIEALTVEHVYSKSAGYTIDKFRELDNLEDIPESVEIRYYEDEENVFSIIKLLNTVTPEAMKLLAGLDMNVSLDDNGEPSEYLNITDFRYACNNVGWKYFREGKREDKLYFQLDRSLILPVDSPDNLVPGNQNGLHFALIRDNSSPSFYKLYALYYTEGDHKLVGLTEFKVHTKENYPGEPLIMSQLEQGYPDFAEISLEENDEYYVYCIKMRDLQGKERIRQLAYKLNDHFYIGEEHAGVEPPNVIDANFFAHELQESSFRRADPSDYAFLDLSW